MALAAAAGKRFNSMIDLLPLAAGLAFLAAALAFRFPLWRPVAALLPHAPEEFTAAFAALRSHQQFVLFPLGVLTTIATIVALLQQGTRSARGRLRVIATASLIAASLISTAAADPLAAAIIAGAPELGADALATLAHRWSNWQWVNLALAVSGGVALVLAHRMPTEAPAADASGMTQRHRNLLLLLGAATLFEGYDRFIISLALPYIGRDLGISEADLGYSLSLIRIGALLSILLGRVADGFGRRRVLVATILAYTLATAATGLSTGLVTFVLFQLVATIFLTAELALAQVVIAEEFPAGARGRGQGLLGAFAALGAGVAALLFPLLQATPLGWRGLYFIGLLPLVLIAFLRRNMPETERWQRLQDEAHRKAGLFDIFQPGLRLRFVVLIVLAASATLVAAPMFSFASYRATNTFGWTPAQVSSMMVAGGGLGLSGWFIFGRLADTVGRRVIGAITIVCAAVGVAAFYRTSWLLPAFALIVFSEAGVSIAINSLGTELFPTALRATAKSWITNAGILGAMIGLAVVGALSQYVGGVHVAISMLVAVPLLSLPLIFLLPETSGQELESIAPEEERGPVHG
jgi:putative MFS transporter